MLSLLFWWMVGTYCWLNSWPWNPPTWRGDSVTLFLTLHLVSSWPMSLAGVLSWDLKWRWSNVSVMFSGQADVPFSPLLPTCSLTLSFIRPSTSIGLDFILTLMAPRCYLLIFMASKSGYLWPRWTHNSPAFFWAHFNVQSFQIPALSVWYITMSNLSSLQLSV